MDAYRGLVIKFKTDLPITPEHPTGVSPTSKLKGYSVQDVSEYTTKLNAWVSSSGSTAIVLPLHVWWGDQHHANVLLVNRRKEVYIFDPYGSADGLYYQPVCREVEEVLMPALHLEGYTLVEWEFPGPQKIEEDVHTNPEGFCVAWCCWFGLEVLLNPSSDPVALVQKIMGSKSGQTLWSQIRKFVLYMEQVK
jgi:hypothetical protein